VLKFDVKYLPVEVDRDGRGQANNADMVKADVVNWIRTLCEGDPWLRDHQPELIWYQHCIPHYLDPSHPLVGLMSGGAQNVMGWSNVSGFPAGCDARHLQNRAGVPTVIFGPGDLQYAHSIDERVSVQEYLDAIKVLALAIHDWTSEKKIGQPGEHPDPKPGRG
jgi:acetylornithine deacetylase